MYPKLRKGPKRATPQVLASMHKPSRIAVVGRSTREIESGLKLRGFYLVKANPELVVSFGGDGTLLHAERMFPSVPKVCVRHDRLCNNCIAQIGKKSGAIKLPKHQAFFFCRNCFPQVAARLASSRTLKLKAFDKLEGQAYGPAGEPKGEAKLALNEVSVHHQRPQQALRGSVWHGQKPALPSFVADGVLVSTAFGSSGYFYSCTRKLFSKGIGIALVNPVSPTAPILISSLSKGGKVGRDYIKISLSRRHGLFYADNDMHSVHLDTGDYVLVRQSSQKAYFAQL